LTVLVGVGGRKLSDERSVHYPCGARFFFSSRRRHTISKRDWSSDVCSSDLVMSDLSTVLVRIVLGWQVLNWMSSKSLSVAVNDRSEERRVGKECRSRWLP